MDRPEIVSGPVSTARTRREFTTQMGELRDLRTGMTMPGGVVLRDAVDRD